jgi:hypothetical protein
MSAEGQACDVMHWEPRVRWYLKGTHLVLVENAAGGWFVVDERDEDTTVGKALNLVKAKQLGLRLARSEPKYMRIAR